MTNLYVTYVYILKCSDNSYYTGKTDNIDVRIVQHNLGTFKGYTFKRRPVKLLWSQGFISHIEAIQTERQIKGWTRAKKEALITGKLDLLHELAKCKNDTSYLNR